MLRVASTAVRRCANNQALLYTSETHRFAMRMIRSPYECDRAFRLPTELAIARTPAHARARRLPHAGDRRRTSAHVGAWTPGRLLQYASQLKRPWSMITALFHVFRHFDQRRGQQECPITKNQCSTARIGLCARIGAHRRECARVILSRPDVTGSISIFHSVTSGVTYAGVRAIASSVGSLWVSV